MKGERSHCSPLICQLGERKHSEFMIFDAEARMSIMKEHRQQNQILILAYMMGQSTGHMVAEFLRKRKYEHLVCLMTLHVNQQWRYLADKILSLLWERR